MARCPSCGAFEGSDHHSACSVYLAAVKTIKPGAVFHRHDGIDYASGNDCPRCWEQSCEILNDVITMFRQRIRTLEAGIEPLRHRLASSNSIPVSRVVLDEQDCARLRALLNEETQA